jgi:hypothetical protein
MNLHDIVNRIELGDLTPYEVDNFRNYCAVWLFRYFEEFGEVSSQGALWQTANADNYKSQAACEKAWKASERGQRETLVKNLIQGVEHIQNVLTSQHFQLTRAMKETHGL